MINNEGKISIAKIFTIDFISLFVACTFGAGVSWATITYGQDAQDTKINFNSDQIILLNDIQQKEFNNIRQEIKQIQIQNATITNEQTNQSKNIEHMVRMLERMKDKIG